MSDYFIHSGGRVRSSYEKPKDHNKKTSVRTHTNFISVALAKLCGEGVFKLTEGKKTYYLNNKSAFKAIIKSDSTLNYKTFKKMSPNKKAELLRSAILQQEMLPTKQINPKASTHSTSSSLEEKPKTPNETRMDKNFDKALNEHSEQAKDKLNGAQLKKFQEMAKTQLEEAEKDPTTLKQAQDFSKEVHDLVQKYQKDVAVHATPAEVKASLEKMQALKDSPPSTTLSHSEHSSFGLRKTMEDDHFFLETPTYFLTGVFDGHGDQGIIAEHVKKQFPLLFDAELKKDDSDIFNAFQNTFNNLQKQIVDQDPIPAGGCTAVVSYIDKTTKTIYTATLGDSETKIYRVINGEMKSIPLSCMRDWGSKKDFARLLKAEPELWTALSGRSYQDEMQAILQERGAAFLTHNVLKPSRTEFDSINVSRSLGDHEHRGENGVIQKAKITKTQLLPGDIVVVGCDGLFDYTNESDIVALISNRAKDKSLAEQLVDASVNEQYQDGDNVTVIAFEVSSI